eukprot:g51227.t1
MPQAAEAASTGDSSNGDFPPTQSYPPQYKTRLCKFFPHGMCTRGTECTFLHPHDRPSGFGEGVHGTVPMLVPAVLPNGLPTMDAQGNVVFIPTPLPYHQSRFKYKTEVCKFFSDGKCKKGGRCSFIHPGAEPSIPFRIKPCIFYERGCCKRGNECTFRHHGPPRKPQPPPPRGPPGSVLPPPPALPPGMPPMPQMAPPQLHMHFLQQQQQQQQHQQEQQFLLQRQQQHHQQQLQQQ